MNEEGKGSWLVEFATAAEATDRLTDSTDHVALVAAGLMGEAGSIVAEVKKRRRERDAYPAYRGRMVEEIGDFLWYYVRLVALVDRGLLSELHEPRDRQGDLGATGRLDIFLTFGSAVGALVAAVEHEGTAPPKPEGWRSRVSAVWGLLWTVAREVNVGLREAAERNARKTASRWPEDREYVGLFDDDFPEEEQLPRTLSVEFRDRLRGAQKVVMLRCNDLNFGDRLTDNIEDPDGYRYHDIFHFAHAVHLGWSPVVRALFHCKRKSKPTVDEAQDGARAVILDEAVAAIVFSRAKRLNYFEGIDHVDFDLLKTIKEFVEGYEVECVPLWQWEAAILDGYRVFRLLRSNGGGRVTLDLRRHALTYMAPSTG